MEADVETAKEPDMGRRSKEHHKQPTACKKMEELEPIEISYAWCDCRQFKVPTPEDVQLDNDFVIDSADRIVINGPIKEKVYFRMKVSNRGSENIGFQTLVSNKKHFRCEIGASVVILAPGAEFEFELSIKPFSLKPTVKRRELVIFKYQRLANCPALQPQPVPPKEDTTSPKSEPKSSKSAKVETQSSIVERKSSKSETQRLKPHQKLSSTRETKSSKTERKSSKSETQVLKSQKSKSLIRERMTEGKPKTHLDPDEIPKRYVYVRWRYIRIFFSEEGNLPASIRLAEPNEVRVIDASSTMASLSVPNKRLQALLQPLENESSSKKSSQTDDSEHSSDTSSKVTKSSSGISDSLLKHALEQMNKDSVRSKISASENDAFGEVAAREKENEENSWSGRNDGEGVFNSSKN